jgi:hypothetical protein
MNPIFIISIIVVISLVIFYTFFGRHFIKSIVKSNDRRMMKGSRESFVGMYDGDFQIKLYGATTNAESYNTGLKNYYTKLQDSLLVPKYRTQYEDVVHTLEDIIGLMVVEITLSIDVKSMTQQEIVDQMDRMGTLIQGYHNLEQVYNILDKA